MSNPFRRAVVVATVAMAALFSSLVLASAGASAAEHPELAARFEYLSQNGNSNCSAEFVASIATMPVMQRLRGSCCSPMDPHRYMEQVVSLRRFADDPMIPADPYDIPAGLAQKLMPYYDDDLSGAQQAAYDYAMANSDEKGPCCCQCWRWQVYGGLAKYLIAERGFSGERVTEVWNLSNGCGGGAEHREISRTGDMPTRAP